MRQAARHQPPTRGRPSPAVRHPPPAHDVLIDGSIRPQRSFASPRRICGSPATARVYCPRLRCRSCPKAWNFWNSRTPAHFLKTRSYGSAIPQIAPLFECLHRIGFGGEISWSACSCSSPWTIRCAAWLERDALSAASRAQSVGQCMPEHRRALAERESPRASIGTTARWSVFALPPSRSGVDLVRRLAAGGRNRGLANSGATSAAAAARAASSFTGQRPWVLDGDVEFHAQVGLAVLVASTIRPTIGCPPRRRRKRTTDARPAQPPDRVGEPAVGRPGVSTHADRRRSPCGCSGRSG
jgi:hypothetical protein